MPFCDDHLEAVIDLTKFKLEKEPCHEMPKDARDVFQLNICLSYVRGLESYLYSDGVYTHYYYVPKIKYLQRGFLIC